MSKRFVWATYEHSVLRILRRPTDTLFSFSFFFVPQFISHPRMSQVPNSLAHVPCNWPASLSSGPIIHHAMQRLHPHPPSPPLPLGFSSASLVPFISRLLPRAFTSQVSSLYYVQLVFYWSWAPCRVFVGVIRSVHPMGQASSWLLQGTSVVVERCA